MAQDRRMTRRIAGLLKARLPDTRLDDVADPRHARGKRWKRLSVLLRELVQAYGARSLFTLVSADAGMCTGANAAIVRGHDLHYLFGLKQSQPTLLAEAQRLLGHRRAQAVAETVDVVGSETVTRRLYVTTEMAQYAGWDHLQTVLRVQSLTHAIATGALRAEESRSFVCSLALDALSPEQWLHAVRRHWGVENDCHNIWDKILREDEHPWIVAGHGACQGTLNVMLLRRIACNLLALFRQVTQRAEERRQTPWLDLIRWVYNALIAAQADDVVGLRRRNAVAAALA